MTATLGPEPGLITGAGLAELLWTDIAPVLHRMPEQLGATVRPLLREVVPLMVSAAGGAGRWSDETASRVRGCVTQIARVTDDLTPIVGVIDELTSRVLHVVMADATSAAATSSPREVSAMGGRLVAELLAGAHHAAVRMHRGAGVRDKRRRAHELLKGTHADGDHDLAPAYAVVTLHSPTPFNPDAVTGIFERVAGEGTLAALGTTSGFALLPAADEVRAVQLARQAHAELSGRLWLAASWRPRGEIAWGRQEASKVLSLVLGAGYEPGVYQLGDVLVEYAITHVPSVSENLIEIIAPLLGQPVLFETLKALIAADGNRRLAATQLIIHRSTLDYRIHRIEQLTGVRPGSVSGINILSAALTAHAVTAKNDQPQPVD